MVKRIRVLQVLEATVGGTRRHLVSLAAGLDREKFDVQVAAPYVREGTGDDKSFAKEIDALGIRFHPIGMCRQIRPLIDLRALSALIRLMRKEKYDIVHLHSSKAGFLGRIAAKVNGIPTVYTPNGLYFLGATSLHAKWAYLWLERVAGLLTDCLIAVSDSERDIVRESQIISDRKVVTIPNAIDFSLVQPSEIVARRVRSALRIPEHATVVGTVARHIDQKDPFNLVRAASLVLERRSDTVFIWCGEGYLKEQTEALAADLGIRESFRFLGFRSDVTELMSIFDLMVLPSLFEGLPYVLLEAMSLGKPIIATDVVGNRDIVLQGHTGLLVPPRNSTQLGQAILCLLNEPDLRTTMGKLGRELGQQKYDLAKLVADVETVYFSLANSVEQSPDPGG